MKKIVVLCLTMLAVTAAQAQETYTSSGKSLSQVHRNQRAKDRKFDPSKIVVGGSIGLLFGNVTAVGVTPVVGYKFTDHFAAGIGLGYQYYRVKDYFAVPDPSTVPTSERYYPLNMHTYTAGLWARYIFLENFFLQAGYEHNFTNFTYYSGALDLFTNKYEIRADKQRIGVPSVLVGGGIRQPLSDRVSIILAALYDVLQRDYSPYQGRIDFRVQVLVGF